MAKLENIEERAIVRSETPEDAKEAFYSDPQLDIAEISPETIKELEGKIYEAIKGSLGDMSGLIGHLGDWDRKYDNDKEEPKEPWMSNVHIPMLSIKIDGLVSRFKRMLDIKPFYKFVSEAIDKDKLLIINNWFQDLIEKKMNWKKVVNDVCFNAAKQKTAIGVLTWEKKITRRKRVEVFNTKEAVSYTHLTLPTNREV